MCCLCIQQIRNWYGEPFIVCHFFSSSLWSSCLQIIYQPKNNKIHLLRLQIGSFCFQSGFLNHVIPLEKQKHYQQNLKVLHTHTGLLTYSVWSSVDLQYVRSLQKSPNSIYRFFFRNHEAINSSTLADEAKVTGESDVTQVWYVHTH